MYIHIPKIFCLLIFTFVAVTGCNKLFPESPDDENILDGPVEGLTAEQNAIFLSGDIAFNDEIFTRETGLGPLFVATSCGTCHIGDGKGHPFTMLTRFGQRDTFLGNLYLQMGGPQLQHRAIPGFMHETLPAGTSSSNFLPPQILALVSRTRYLIRIY